MRQGASPLTLHHSLAHAIALGIGSSLLRIGRQLRRGQAYWVLGRWHIEMVHHHLHPSLSIRSKTELAVELLAFSAAVVSVAVGVKGAVVGHQPHQALRTKAAAQLHIRAVHAKRSRVVLHLRFWRSGRIACKGLNHPACRISIQLSQGAAQNFNSFGRCQTDRRPLPLTIGRGGRNSVY